MKGFGAVGGRDAGGVEQVFRTPRNAVERSAIMAGRNLCVCAFRLLKRVVASKGDDAVNPGIESLDARKIDASEPFAGQPARFDPAREFSERSKGDLLVAARQRACICATTDELVAAWARGGAGEG